MGSAYFREARHVYGMNEKGYMLVNIGQIENQILPNRAQCESFCSLKMQQNQKGPMSKIRPGGENSTNICS